MYTYVDTLSLIATSVHPFHLSLSFRIYLNLIAVQESTTVVNGTISMIIVKTNHYYH